MRTKSAGRPPIEQTPAARSIWKRCRSTAPAACGCWTFPTEARREALGEETRSAVLKYLNVDSPAMPEATQAKAIAVGKAWRQVRPVFRENHDATFPEGAWAGVHSK